MEIKIYNNKYLSTDFDKLYSQFVKRYRGSPNIESIVAESILALLQKEGIANAEAYLNKIILNRIRSYLKKEKQQKNLKKNYSEFANRKSLISKDPSQSTVVFIAALKPLERHIVEMHLKNFTDKEIGSIVGLSRETIKKKRQRAVKKCKKLAKLGLFSAEEMLRVFFYEEEFGLFHVSESIRKIFMLLDVKEQEILRMYYGDGMNDKVISLGLGTSYESLKKKRLRVVNKMREYIESYISYKEYVKTYPSLEREIKYEKIAMAKSLKDVPKQYQEVLRLIRPDL